MACRPKSSGRSRSRSRERTRRSWGSWLPSSTACGSRTPTRAKASSTPRSTSGGRSAKRQEPSDADEPEGRRARDPTRAHPETREGDGGTSTTRGVSELEPRLRPAHRRYGGADAGDGRQPLSRVPASAAEGRERGGREGRGRARGAKGQRTGDHAGGLRSRRLPVSWSRQGTCGGGPGGRPQVLRSLTRFQDVSSEGSVATIMVAFGRRACRQNGVLGRRFAGRVEPTRECSRRI